MKRILIVEDHSDIRGLLRLALDFDTFEIHEANDGRGGLKTCMAVLPDLVLLDVMMPGELDGYQVCTRIKANAALQHIPVVLLTARNSVADLEMGQRCGADRYLIKPFSPQQLIEVVEHLLASQPS